MIRNDYRRALIMLRGLENGYSGHVRLERRTLNGTVQFTVNSAPSAQPLHALLLSEKNGRYQAVNLGALRRDSRGQYALMAAFDPRNIQGLDLNDYALLGVARTGNDGPALVMSGYVNGTRQINWRGVRDAVTTLQLAVMDRHDVAIIAIHSAVAHLQEFSHKNGILDSLLWYPY